MLRLIGCIPVVYLSGASIVFEGHLKIFLLRESTPLIYAVAIESAVFLSGVDELTERVGYIPRKLRSRNLEEGISDPTLIPHCK
jgi:hypothetical protein